MPIHHPATPYDARCALTGPRPYATQGSLSPRLLRTLTRDRFVHVTLALFAGTFTYALAVLRKVHDEASGTLDRWCAERQPQNRPGAPTDAVAVQAGAFVGVDGVPDNWSAAETPSGLGADAPDQHRAIAAHLARLRVTATARGSDDAEQVRLATLVKPARAGRSTADTMSGRRSACR